MHASIVELLSLRDAQPVAADKAAHVAGCAVCTSELKRLTAVRGRLHSLGDGAANDAQIEVVAGRVWTRVSLALDIGANPSRRKTSRYLVAAAALIWAAVGIAWFGVGDTDDAEPVMATLEDGLPESLAALLAESQELDSTLQKLPERPRVERAATAATIEALESQIQLVDYLLSGTGARGLTIGQAEGLWIERVELMTSLVSLRSAQAGNYIY